MAHHTPNFHKLREDFPMLKSTMHGKPLIYLDSAATSHKPQVVIDSLNAFYQQHYGTVHRAVYELAVNSTQAYEATREKVRALLNAAKTEEIVFTRGATEAINIVAQSFGKAFIKPGDEILISAMEHHSNIVPWQMLCEERKAHLKIIPMNDKGELLLDSYAQLLNNRTKLVAVCHIANSIGTQNPIKQIIDMAHHAGAKVLVDGAQSVPHLSVDVQSLDADFYVFSGHKIYGPTGVGALYGKENLLHAMPPHYGGGDMIDTVTFEKTTYNTPPLKFEAGTPNIGGVVGLGTAIDYVRKIGFQHIQKWEHELLMTATGLLEKIDGLQLIGTASQKGAIVAFVAEGTHPLDIGTMLDLQGIAIRTGHHCAQPTMRHFGISSACRASFAFYNTKSEVEAFAEALKKVIRLLRK